MSKLKLSDVKLVENHHYTPEAQFEDMIRKLGDSRWDYREKTVTRQLIPVSTNTQIDGVKFYHKNYLEYLTRCWSLHYGIVIDPNIIWYTLLCELALRVKQTPETYRSIFTTSNTKKTIEIPYDGVSITLDLNLLMFELRRDVPTDTDSFFPEFSTNSSRSRLAQYAAFADMASPYYNYMMKMCGFPAIDVKGSLDDWKLLASKWEGLKALFSPLGRWFERVQTLLDRSVSEYDNAEWWKGIYTNDRCGSGSDVEINGWFADLFYEKCKLPKLDNFSSCVSTVDYLRIAPGSKLRFKMKQGLFFSLEHDGFLVPEFGHFLFNVSDEPQTITPEIQNKSQGRVIHLDEPVYRLEPESLMETTKGFD